MVIIYPHDPSTKFLSIIIEEIEAKILKPNVDRVLPSEYEKTKQIIIELKSSETMIFLGHGSSFGLSGGCYSVDGRETLINRDEAIKIFQKKKLILLSCKSADLLNSLNYTFESAIGFGNIVTGFEDLNGNREKKKFRDFRSIEKFREKLAVVFANTIIEAYLNDFTFLQVYNALRLRINKSLSSYSLSVDANERLAGELMFEFKKNMVLLGNPDSFINK